MDTEWTTSKNFKIFLREGAKSIQAAACAVSSGH